MPEAKHEYSKRLMIESEATVNHITLALEERAKAALETINTAIESNTATNVLNAMFEQYVVERTACINWRELKRKLEGDFDF